MGGGGRFWDHCIGKGINLAGIDSGRITYSCRKGGLFWGGGGFAREG